MGDREQRRAELVPVLARLMRSRDLLNELQVVAPGVRTSTMLATLPDDTMESVWERLADAPEGPAVLGVYETGTWRIALMWRAEADVPVFPDSATAEVDDAAEASMFLDLLDGETATLVHRGPRVAARRLVDRGEPLPT